MTIQAQILRLLGQLQRQLNMAVLLISHNLGIVEEFADRVAVMYAGQIVENGTSLEVLGDPRHPYTRALLRAVPRLGVTQETLRAIPGQVPLAGEFPMGCRFQSRCDVAVTTCTVAVPELDEIAPDRSVRCPIRDDRAGSNGAPTEEESV